MLSQIATKDHESIKAQEHKSKLQKHLKKNLFTIGVLFRVTSFTDYSFK